VGNRGRYKNFYRLLEGFASTSVKNRIYLIIAGAPWRQEELERIKELGLDSCVRLVLNPTDTLLAALYTGALAFIYPSLGEGFGIPLLEAMACETLVLASDIPVFREVAGDGAMYFDPYQPDDIARVLEIAASGSGRSEYIRRGIRQVAKYSWDKCAAETYDVYRKALESWR
jgi:glycosyltransferase involved in cell wall biosynthesis